MKCDILRGKHLKAVPTSIKTEVKIMEGLSPWASKNHKTGMAGIKYMIFPQFPSKASVESVHSGQNIVSKDVEMGPKEFQIIP